MPITTRCPECGHKYRFDEKHAGRQAKCKNGHVFTVTPEVQPVAGAQQAPPEVSAVRPSSDPAQVPPQTHPIHKPKRLISRKVLVPGILVVVLGLAAAVTVLFSSKTGNTTDGNIAGTRDVLSQGLGLFPAWSTYRKKSGFVNRDGEFVIKPQFDHSSMFSEGLAAVGKDGKVGYIDAQGHFVIEPAFDSASCFSEGYARVEFGKRYSFIDKAGKLITTSMFDDATYFSEGLASVEVNGKWGFIDRSGSLAIKPQFDCPNGMLRPPGFREGLALVCKGTDVQELFFINKQGDVVIPSSDRWHFVPAWLDAFYRQQAGFSDGLCCVMASSVDGTTGYIDKSGKMVIPMKYLGGQHFSEGLAPVGVPTGPDANSIKYGYIDRSGKMVISPRFEHASPFSEGLASVLIGVRVGYINKEGELEIKPQFYPGGADLGFHGGLAEVCLRAGPSTGFLPRGCINRNGDLIWRSDRDLPHVSEDNKQSLLQAATGKPGDIEAQVRLGMFLLPSERPQLQRQGVELLRMAAERGDARGQRGLARAYKDGLGVSQDFTEARKWAEKAAASGWFEAQYELGAIYLSERAGPERDPQKGMLWLRKSAEQGFADAQLYFGAHYMSDGPRTNDRAEEAMKWIAKAADQGEPFAQYMLGLAYLAGTGVTKDRDKGIQWLIWAAENGNEDAINRLRRE